MAAKPNTQPSSDCAGESGEGGSPAALRTRAQPGPAGRTLA